MSHEAADRARAAIADLIDRQLSPPGHAAMQALEPVAGERVLDVGCGAGATVCELAMRVGESGRVVGVDIARHVLAVARRRTAQLAQVTLRLADAAALDLPEASFDAIYSRFGVMAFDDPIAAFGALRRLMRRGGRLAFVCWRSLDENELDLFPLRVAGLCNLADKAPFSFADPAFIRNTLHASGFINVAVSPFDAMVTSGDVSATLTVLTTVGALGAILRRKPWLTDAARVRLAEALARLSSGDVRLNAATWIVTATSA